MLEKMKVLLLLLLPLTMASQADRKALETVAKGNMAFTTNLYKSLRQQEGNVFFSPISVEVILALVYTGAGGNTAEQMSAALKLPEDRNVLETGFRDLMESLESTDNMTLEMANKIFGQESYPLEANFKTIAEKSFLSAAQEVDFAKDPEGSRNIINQWVEERTNKKITNIIPPDLLDSMTKLVLVNAIYFKGKWKSPFNVQLTRPQPFYITPEETKEVQMMYIKKKFGYAKREDLKAKVLVMPYVGDQISMVILLPDALDGLSDLENQLNGLDLADLVQSVENSTVEVSLPRFTFETTVDLNDSLQKLGMTDMFAADKADFSGITKVGGLYVSNVLQKAFIEVNEEGSEAAAATVAGVPYRSREYGIPTFRADHPMLFLLIHSFSNVVVFMGRFQDPS